MPTPSAGWSALKSARAWTASCRSERPGNRPRWITRSILKSSPTRWNLPRARSRSSAGTGSNSTSEAVYLTKGAEKVGADGTLQVAPYYNKPTQEGLYQHFLEISRATKLPMILYSIPSRCGVEIAVDTVRRLAAATPRIVGIKEAGGNPDRVTQLRAALGRQFTIFSGDDSLTLPFMALGAHGVISVASNVIPRRRGPDGAGRRRR